MLKIFVLASIVSLFAVAYGSTWIFVPGASEPAFVPTDIASLELWFDGTDINGNGDNNAGLNDNDVMTAGWQDKSGNSFDAVDPSDYTAPNVDTNVQNSKTCVKFTSATPTALEVPDNDALSCITGCTVFVVAKMPASLTSPAGSRIISKEETFDGANGTGLEWGFQAPWFDSSGNDFGMIVFGSGTGIASAHIRKDSDILAVDTAYTMYGSYNGGTAGATDVHLGFQGTKNTGDTTVATGSSLPPDNTAAKVRLGARFTAASPSNQEFNGHICEILFFSEDLSDENKDAVFLYLKTKWATYAFSDFRNIRFAVLPVLANVGAQAFGKAS